MLNLYSGVGGNRKLWKDCEVTAVEFDPRIAAVYKKLHPSDEVVIGDAHKYLLDNYDKYDFIWSSPPCQTHSKMVKATRHRLRRYTDLKLYEEIMLLQKDYRGDWVVENVVPYYKPLIEPTVKVGRHLFWSNKSFKVEDIARPADFIKTSGLAGAKALQDWLDIHFEETIYYGTNRCPAQILRNCVHPKLGESIFTKFTETKE